MQKKMGSVPPVPVEVQFAQKLAANEPVIRNKAVKKIKKWFSARTEPFSEMEMMRLWKGLYYCFWMSDKPLVQEDLAENISSFVLCFQSEEASLLFIQSFLQTFCREWAGIDRWRKDKFMMFTRRFLRSSFRLLANNDWNKETVEKLVEIFSSHLILCPQSKAPMEFKLHFTDVFLEELAKVAKEKLATDMLELFLDPFLEAIKTCDEDRYRDHVVERVFKHLLRQSDPGLRWQDGDDEDDDEEEQKDVEDEEEKDDEEEGDDGEDQEYMEVDDDEEGESNLADDPRAGGVHSVIPQLKVDYNSLSEKMFKFGSTEKLSQKSRKHFYELSKMFKDVAGNVFPLGPNLKDIDQDIEKINVKKAAKQAIREREEIVKQSNKEKLDYKKGLKEAAKMNGVMNGDNIDHGDDDVVDDEAKDNDDKDDDDNEMDVKPKLSSKERKKLHKKEQKKRKQERLQKQAEEEQANMEKKEAEKKIKDLAAKAMIDQDIERKSVEVVDKLKKKKKSSVLGEKIEKLEEKSAKLESLEKKKDKQNLQETIEEVEAVVAETPKSKKKKKDKRKVQDSSKPSDKENNTMKRRLPEEISKEEDTVTEAKKMKDDEMMMKPPESVTEALETTKTKKKKLKKAMYRIDSDIAFNAPSLSQTNLIQQSDAKVTETVVKAPEPTEAVESVDQKIDEVAEVISKKSSEKKKQKKMKKYNAEASLMATPSATPILSSEPAKLNFTVSEKTTPKSSKTKPAPSEASSKSSSNLFEENDWDDDLKQGGTKVTNKDQMKEETTSSIPDCPSPVITPVKNFTATFIKKALSKSEKKSKKLKLVADDKCLSEPRKKRVNVVLTKNKSQAFTEHLKSVKASPQTPHDPNKNPTKSALKKTPGSSSGGSLASLNPVNLNTQLNARSQAAKKMNGTPKSNRKRAMDFF